MIFRRCGHQLTLFALVAICGLSSWTYAQQSSEPPNASFYWINGGLGGASSGMALGLNLSIQPSDPGYLLFSLRSIATAEILGDDITDVGIMVGYSSKKPQSTRYFSVSAGISYVTGSDPGSAVGIPVDVQFFYTPLSFMGFGVGGFADLNTKETFYGILLYLQFGKLR